MSKLVPAALLATAALFSGGAAIAATAKPAPHIVAAKTSTGKTVHYDCSKAGNAHKAACKK